MCFGEVGQASARAKSCSGAGAAEVEVELRRLVVDGRHVDVNFDEFHHLHYYLRQGQGGGGSERRRKEALGCQRMFTCHLACCSLGQ
ncbi:unnamed protein product [Triticum turgidum subsp. durum]|uniref:Uncharacterized protein n=1 Tax=Triticum turgidum subsp. durum TaxID=4567 RepID=A0A9R1P1L0_TRITD|nr:unnamed protein product [Triticum turgidum subsp. durum]